MYLQLSAVWNLIQHETKYFPCLCYDIRWNHDHDTDVQTCDGVPFIHKLSPPPTPSQWVPRAIKSSPFINLGVGQNIALHGAPADKISTYLASFCLPDSLNLIFFSQTSPTLNSGRLCHREWIRAWRVCSKVFCFAHRGWLGIKHNQSSTNAQFLQNNCSVLKDELYFLCIVICLPDWLTDIGIKSFEHGLPRFGWRSFLGCEVVMLKVRKVCME